ncbi:GSCOCG00004714001-RA-CDS [Cotesia congregata]|uniref:Similar to mdh: Malate dehydrogenase (Pyrococcus abyssi (Strain GE5 / Orsay)) n=1 Tax=Cotesia congregata TaxID=51543 RepID=A0A8J2HI84_COTCN|nr:GSCOCG00004714001-RA-CDS [Cotesia congregata]CAG5092127.1 Similar to mdh: Malate dehydrogenase (Pyrococcus abyssi (strain GE5 / Orsay)) [Cotesia congregata]
MALLARSISVKSNVNIKKNISKLSRMLCNWRTITTCSDSQVDDLVVPKQEVIRFITESMHKVGANREDAAVVAQHLMTADYRGHFSHGMNRLAMYISDIENKLTNPIARPETVNDFQAIALVDGKNGLGQVIGKYSMELAIKKAEKYGIGLVSTRGSNHYGICGYYTLMAMEKNLIGFSATNTSPLMVPTRSTQAALGTNPLSIGMRAQNDEFVLDMATTAVALGKIEVAFNKEQDIPRGWALGSDGKITTDSGEALKNHKLMPLGGAEEHSGYKGYGLGVMVELLCGILSGSFYGPNIRNWTDANRTANLGHCFMAIDPKAFGSGAENRLSHLLSQLRALPVSSGEGVLVAGDLERKAMAKVDTFGGIEYHKNQIRICKELAEKLGVKAMELVKKKHYD